MRETSPLAWAIAGLCALSIGLNAYLGGLVGKAETVKAGVIIDFNTRILETKALTNDLVLYLQTTDARIKPILLKHAKVLGIEVKAPQLQPQANALPQPEKQPEPEKKATSKAPKKR